jgi:ABC-2 type transport system permease protein
MWRRMISLLRKEFAQLSRDKAILFILIWSFTGGIYTAGHGMSGDINNLPIVIYDLCRESESRDLISRFRPPYFKVMAYLQAESEITEWLDSGKASLAVIIPPDFKRKIAAGEQAKVQTISDGTISMSATLAIGYIAQISDAYSRQILEKRGQAASLSLKNLPVIDERLRVQFNPNVLSSWFTALLELFNMFTMISLLLTAAAMVREKEYGTLEQLLLSPANPSEIFMAKIIPTVMLVLPLSSLSIFLILKGTFHIPIRGSLVLFYAVTAIYVFTISSLGIAIATVSRNLAQAMMTMFLVLMPMLYLSGAWTPPEAMSPVVRVLTLLSPMRYFIDFGFNVLFKGNGFFYIWPDIIGILIMGVLLFSFSKWWFHRSIAK